MSACASSAVLANTVLESLPYSTHWMSQGNSRHSAVITPICLDPSWQRCVAQDSVRPLNVGTLNITSETQIIKLHKQSTSTVVIHKTGSQVSASIATQIELQVLLPFPPTQAHAYSLSNSCTTVRGYYVYVPEYHLLRLYDWLYN